nr:hypothetical protein B0A51_01620 [Rachicladosporium sp. CCFEE 5018]
MAPHTDAFQQAQHLASHCYDPRRLRPDLQNASAPGIHSMSVIHTTVSYSVQPVTYPCHGQEDVIVAQIPETTLRAMIVNYARMHPNISNDLWHEHQRILAEDFAKGQRPLAEQHAYPQRARAPKRA